MSAHQAAFVPVVKGKGKEGKEKGMFVTTYEGGEGRRGAMNGEVFMFDGGDDGEPSGILHAFAFGLLPVSRPLGRSFLVSSLGERG